MGATTTRLALPYPVGGDPTNVPGDVQRLAQALDSVSVVYLENTAANRPLPAIHGRIYLATDTSAVYYDTGTAWIQLNVNPSSVVTTKGDLLVASGAGALARLGVGTNGQVPIAQSGAANGIQWGNVLGLPLALTGAVSATRFVGATVSGAPTSGTFAVGDFSVAQNGHLWICTAAGTPGTWVDSGAAASSPGQPLGLSGATTATRYVGGTTSGSPSTGTFATGDFVVAQNGIIWICTAGGSPGTWSSIDTITIQTSLNTIRTSAFGGSGRTTPPVVEVRATADRSIGASTDSFEDAQLTAVVDPGSCFVSGTQPTGGYISVPITGRYRVTWKALMANAVNVWNACHITLNGVSVASNCIASDLQYSGTGAAEAAVLTAIVEDRVLAAGDKLYFAIWSGGTPTIKSTWFLNKTSVFLAWVGPA